MRGSTCAAQAPHAPRALPPSHAARAPQAAARRDRGWSRSAAQTAQAHTARRRWKRHHPAKPSRQEQQSKRRGLNALQTRAMVPVVIRLREGANIWDGVSYNERTRAHAHRRTRTHAHANARAAGWRNQSNVLACAHGCITRLRCALRVCARGARPAGPALCRRWPDARSRPTAPLTPRKRRARSRLR